MKKGAEGGGRKCKEKRRNVIDMGWWKRRITKEWLLKATQVKPGFMHSNSNGFITKSLSPTYSATSLSYPSSATFGTLPTMTSATMTSLLASQLVFTTAPIFNTDLSLNYLGVVSANADKWASWVTYVDVILYCNSYLYSIYLLGI